MVTLNAMRLPAGTPPHDQEETHCLNIASNERDIWQCWLDPEENILSDNKEVFGQAKSDDTYMSRRIDVPGEHKS